jgi:hypothetical protein
LIGCTGPCAIGTTAIAQERFTSQAQWFAALTGRFGYAANDWLFYGKAGGAWMDVRYTEDLLTAGAPVTAATQVFTDIRSLTMPPRSDPCAGLLGKSMITGSIA